MNKSNVKTTSLRTLVAAAVAATLIAGCASMPTKSAGVVEVRAKLTALQSDANLSTRAPAAMKEAEGAVRAAEMPQTDAELGAHRVYIADRKVEIARSMAQTRYAEDQRSTLTAQRDSARLDARTQEADAANAKAATARAEGAAAKLSAEQARSDADAASLAAAASQQQSMELQQQVDALQAKVTDRGIVLTLEDVLFATGGADFKVGAKANLERLVAFLNHYPNRTVLIEGHTDSVGTASSNQALSERRAASVRSYLTGQGIDAQRVTTAGKGQDSPVAGNGTAEGRQQNRRVEVIITNPAMASR